MPASPAAWGSQTKAIHGCTENANAEPRTFAKLFEIYVMLAAPAPHAPTLVRAPEEFLLLLDCLGLRLDAIDRFDELGSRIGRRIRQDDQPDPVAFPPQNVGAVRNIRRQRRQQYTVERFLRDPVFLGSRLRMTADGDIPQPRNISIEVIHAVLQRDYRKTPCALPTTIRDRVRRTLPCPMGL